MRWRADVLELSHTGWVNADPLAPDMAWLAVTTAFPLPRTRIENASCFETVRADSTKEMMQPCPIDLHVISLVPLCDSMQNARGECATAPKRLPYYPSTCMSSLWSGVLGGQAAPKR